MNTTKPTLSDFDRSRLIHATNDWRNLSTAYPILAAHGLMETTPNGYRAIDPETILRRIDQLLNNQKP